MSFAQSKRPCTYNTPNAKANKLYTKAKKLYNDKKNYTESKKLFLEAAKEDSLFIRAYKELGRIAYTKKDYPTAALAYTKYIKLCESASPNYYYKLGKAFYFSDNFSTAYEVLDKYIYLDEISEDKAKEAESLMVKSQLKAKPVPFNPKPLVGVSTRDPEYLPAITADGEFCYFTRKYQVKTRDNLTPKTVENFMIAQKINGAYNSGKAMTTPFNRSQNNNEGGASITINNKELFFTVNKNGNFDIYYSKHENGSWSEIQNVSEAVNDPVRWDSQPSISSDGRTLYFASYRDPIGTCDIYRATRNESGEWSSPELLSNVINTAGNEKSPFIHPDNKTLYFSSDAHYGMGGYDIFYSKLDENDKWSEPVNIGYPINTEGDEVGFIVSTDGKQAYFASNSLGGYGGYDIYSFELHKEAAPEKVLFVKGTLKDNNDVVPTKAKIELKNVATKEVTKIDYDTLTGDFAKVILYKDDLLLTVENANSTFDSRYFSVEDTSTLQTQKVDLSVKQLNPGQNFKLNNILFTSNSFELNEVAKTVIDHFADYLNRNSNLSVEIQGHTDDVGDDVENLELSNNRALAVYEYLLNSGIANTRLAYKGYGETHPVESNETEDGRRKNRRTEIVIVSN